MSARTHFVYRAFDENGRLLYIGCTQNIDQRRDNHRTASTWWQFAHRFTIAGPFPKGVALAMETYAIETEGSAFNGTNDDRRVWLRWSRACRKAWDQVAPHHELLDERGRVDSETLTAVERLVTDEVRSRGIPEPRTDEHRLASYLASTLGRAAA